MSQSERDRLRKLQDRWLALPAVKAHIRNHGEDEYIAGGGYVPDAPSFKDVRTTVLPEWEQWFKDFFQ